MDLLTWRTGYPVGISKIRWEPGVRTGARAGVRDTDTREPGAGSRDTRCEDLHLQAVTK
jgi:hypothetical protein